MGPDQVDRLADPLVGRDAVARRYVDDRVPGVGGEGEQAREPVQPVVVAEQQADGRVAKGLPGLDDTVLARPVRGLNWRSLSRIRSAS